jgi:hypothetical protein
LKENVCKASALYRRDASRWDRARRNPIAKDVVIRVELRRAFDKGEAKDESKMVIQTSELEDHI